MGVSIMAGKINFGKIAVVVFLTALIWVWADLAKTGELPVQNVIISVTKSVDPALLISLDGKPQLFLEQLVLSGPTSKIAEAKKKLDEGSLEMIFFYEPSAKAVESGGEDFNVLDYLRQDPTIKDLGLAVKSCQPATAKVAISKLVKKSLKVRCLDENGKVLDNIAVEPTSVNMYVPADWEGERLVAYVKLSENDISRARENAIDKKPYIELQAGYPRQAEEVVLAKAPSKENLSKEATITKPILGFLISSNLLGKYDVNVGNYEAVTSPIAITASPAAKLEYEAMNYQVILKVLDSDRDEGPSKVIKRKLMYNFPEEYVRKDEISLNQQPVIAQFRLIPKPPQSPVK